MRPKMACSSLSCVATFPPLYRHGRDFQLRLSNGSYPCFQSEVQLLRNSNVNFRQFSHDMMKFKGRPPGQYIPFGASEDQPSCSGVKSVASEEDKHHRNAEDLYFETNYDFHSEGTVGKPGLISFYNHHHINMDEMCLPGPLTNKSNLAWLVGPFVLVASFILPSLYLRRILSGIFEDSLLTDFLILFFTETLFYCGVAGFLLIADRSRKHLKLVSNSNTNRSTGIPQLAYRISWVVTLVLSLIIPMVTMGLVWPWTGPAASAALAPYLVGIIMQLAFERYAKHLTSPSWPAIPIIFQVYRLHQLNRAAQLVTALSLTVRGAETTSHNLAINSSLATLLNVLQLLGVLCLWSLAAFLMRLCHSPPTLGLF